MCVLSIKVPIGKKKYENLFSDPRILFGLGIETKNWMVVSPGGIVTNVLDCDIIEVIYKVFSLDVAQGHMNEAPNETRNHLCRFASVVY